MGGHSYTGVAGVGAGRRRKILVLCVDRDNDVGVKLGVRTPVVGERELLEIATRYATLEPEDSDSNAMFAAIKALRDIREEGLGDAEVALVAGTPREGLEADMKILKELKEVLSTGEYDSAVLVSDGPTDEQVLPLLQSLIPVISVKRVIVQQSRGIEESFVLFLRYLRMLVEDERYRRYSLGLPGALLILYTVLSSALPHVVWPILMAFTGLVMLVKGYSLDRTMVRLYTSSPLTFTSIVPSLVLALIALAQGAGAVSALEGVAGAEYLGYLMLTHVGGQVFVVDLLVVSAAVLLVGSLLDDIIFDRGVRPVKCGVLALILVMRQVLVEAARMLTGGGSIFMLVVWVLASTAAAIGTTLALTLRHKRGGYVDSGPGTG